MTICKFDEVNANNGGGCVGRGCRSFNSIKTKDPTYLKIIYNMRAYLALRFHSGAIRRLPYVNHMLQIDENHINIHTHPTLNFKDNWDTRLPSNFIHIPS